MIRVNERRDESAGSTTTTPTNGAALSGFLGGSIGAFAMGFFVIVNEIGLFAAPSLYGPAGGVSGRTTFATITWLVAWAVLHHRWRDRVIDPRRVFAVGLLLIGLGFLGTFPPVWTFF